MFTKISKKGQITLPAEVRKLLNLRPGRRVRFIIEKDTARILPAEGGIETLKGTVKVSAPQDFKAARHKAMEERSREKSERTRR
ncbi:MAG: AbrB/MazE/SpoVT family DNA-binding domain-containing protein [Bacillota bacterium]